MSSVGMMPQTLQSRIALGTGLAILATIVVMVGTSTWNSYQSGVSGGTTFAQSLARQQAAQIDAELEVALNTSRALAQALSANPGLHQQAAALQTSTPPPWPGGPKPPIAELALNREGVIAYLKQVLAHNPSFVGVYTLWEPNAFDANDSAFANSPGHDASGRFMAYLSRGAAGSIALEPILDYTSTELGATGVRKGEYYLCSKESGRECVLNPYTYPVQGKDVLMTSFVVPIQIQGKFHGIVGVDIALATLQRRLDSLQLFPARNKLLCWAMKSAFHLPSTSARASPTGRSTS